MPKAALAPEPLQAHGSPNHRHQAINAMVLLYDALQSDREKGAIMELYVTFAWRVWVMNVETFIAKFNAAQNHHGASAAPNR